MPASNTAPKHSRTATMYMQAQPLPTRHKRDESADDAARDDNKVDENDESFPEAR